MVQSRFSIRYDSQIQPDQADIHSLGSFIFGSPASTAPQTIGQTVLCPVLFPPAQIEFEQWNSSKPVTTVTDGKYVVRYDDDYLMGCIELNETEFASSSISADDSSPLLTPLARASAHAYSWLFETLDTYGYPHLWRAWNYIGQINEHSFEVERYRQFNQGRQLGFNQRSRTTLGYVPAACALGALSGSLSVSFFASKTPLIPLENPRQVSAFNYPAQYGVKSPTFSRAALGMSADQELFFLSGTASIVGHETVHLNDPTAQTEETIQNIEALIAQANLKRQRPKAYVLADLDLRVYVRHSTDLSAIRAVLDKHLNGNGQQHLVYVQADICRNDLLVEIEGIAWR
jgi:chorismate lyase / 3-hydroxybenzoate synthase